MAERLKREQSPAAIPAEYRSVPGATINQPIGVSEYTSGKALAGN